MSLFALADLHLSLSNPKPMDKFGPQWENHMERIREQWMAAVGPADVVLVPGDISWAMKEAQAEPDLAFLQELPGQKVLLRGNHDYWWGSPASMGARYPGLFFLQNNFFPYGDWAVCGARGWVHPGAGAWAYPKTPQNPVYTSQDEKLYRRECQRLELSLAAARRAGFHQIVAMTHFPPCDEKGRETGFTRLFAEYGVEVAVYGHLHGAFSHALGPQGVLNGVRYVLAAGDFCHFSPVLVLP